MAAPQDKAPARAGFDMNQPTIVSLLYLAAWVTGFSNLVGLVLAYVWRREAAGSWEESHFTYLIRTFWLGFLYCVVAIAIGVASVLAMIGEAERGAEPGGEWVLAMFAWVFAILAVSVWSAVRAVLSLVKAQNHEPMPRPDSWLV